MSERPEHIAPAEIYFDQLEALSYTKKSKKIIRQCSMSASILDMLKLDNPTKCPSIVLDIGCGTGFTGQLLKKNGHYWIGCDISKHMVLAGGHHTNGDALLADVGDGLPFRENSFDYAVSVSTLQWLCYQWMQETPTERMEAFFGSLFNCLKDEGVAIFQYYPEDQRQIDQLLGVACRCTFYVKSEQRLNKHFLFLSKKHFEPGWTMIQEGLLWSLFIGMNVDNRNILDYEFVNCLSAQESVIRTDVSVDDLHKLTESGGWQEKKRSYHETEDIGEIEEGIGIDLWEQVLIHLCIQESNNISDTLFSSKFEEDDPDFLGLLSTQATHSALASTCKSLYRLRKKSPPLLFYNYTQKKWKEDGIIPSPCALRLERRAMAFFLIQSLLSEWHEPDAHVWVDGLRKSREMIDLDQFLIFMQLVKYLPHEEKAFTPPYIVFRIWYHLIMSPCGAYQKFCSEFIGRYVALSQNETIFWIDLSQFYRCVPSYKSGMTPEEREAREFTCNAVSYLIGYSNFDHWNPDKEDDDPCFGGKTLIKMADGQFKEIMSLKVGDYVMSADHRPQKILLITKKNKKMKNMVKMNDFWITRGHPMLIKGEWVRPDEIKQPVPIQSTEVYGIFNLLLDEDHTVLVGKDEVICCTLGKYCGPRLEQLYPNQNMKYGEARLLPFKAILKRRD